MYLVDRLEPKTPVVWLMTGVTPWSDRSGTHEDSTPDWYRPIFGGVKVGIREGRRLQKYSAVRIFGRSAGGKPNFLIGKVQEHMLATSVHGLNFTAPESANAYLVSAFLSGRALRITEVQESEADTGHHCIRLFCRCSVYLQCLRRENRRDLILHFRYRDRLTW